jgi:hypothetical protein
MPLLTPAYFGADQSAAMQMARNVRPMARGNREPEQWWETTYLFLQVGPHMTSGLSRRAYAKSRHIDEGTVRKHLKSGVLAEALLPDGTIDPQRADELLKAARTKGKTVSIPLATAKLNKEAVLAIKDARVVAELERNLVRPDDSANWVAEGASVIAHILRKFPERVAGSVVGKDGRTIHRLLSEAINDTLNETSAMFAEREQAAKSAVESYVPEVPDLRAMTATQLAAHRTVLQTRKLQLELARDEGILRYGDELMIPVTETIAVVKSRLWALPARCGTQVEAAPSIEVVVGILRAEIEEIVALWDAPVARLRGMQRKSG